MSYTIELKALTAGVQAFASQMNAVAQRFEEFKRRVESSGKALEEALEPAWTLVTKLGTGKNFAEFQRELEKVRASFEALTFKIFGPFFARLEKR